MGSRPSRFRQPYLELLSMERVPPAPRPTTRILAHALVSLTRQRNCLAIFATRPFAADTASIILLSATRILATRLPAEPRRIRVLRRKTALLPYSFWTLVFPTSLLPPMFKVRHF